MKKSKLSAIAWILVVLMTMTFVLAGCSESKTTTPETTASKASAEDPQAPADTMEEPAQTVVKNKLVLFCPLTGNMMQYGESYKETVTMAVEEFNAAGGFNGTPVELEIYDDKGTQTESISVANKIIDDDKVFAVIGSYGSSLTLAAAPIFQEAGIPLVAPNVSHVDFPSIGDLVVSISPTADLEKTVVSQIMCNELGGTLAVIYQNTELGVTSADIISGVYEELGGEIVVKETFTPGETVDFTPILSKFKTAGADNVYIEAEYNDVASILMQADRIGLKAQFVTSGKALKAEFVDIAGDACEGLIVCATGPSYSEAVMATAGYPQAIVDFAEKFKERTGKEADQFAAAGYDAAHMALSAAAKVGPDADAHTLMEAMLEVNFEPVSAATLSYENGNKCIKSVFKYRVENGQFVIYEG